MTLYKAGMGLRPALSRPRPVIFEAKAMAKAKAIGPRVTHVGCDGIFSGSFITNCPESLPVKGFRKSIEN